MKFRTVPRLIALMRHSSQQVKESAGGALLSLCGTENSLSLLGGDGGLAPVVDILSNGTTAGKFMAIDLIASQLSSTQNQQERLDVSRNGGVKALLHFLKYLCTDFENPDAFSSL